MRRRVLVVAIALVFVAGLGLASEKGKAGSWTGWVTDTHCGAKGQNEKHTACANKCVKEMGAKLALYNPADKKVYVLDPQDKVAAHAGHHVAVKGTVAGDTITVTSIEMVAEAKDKPKS